MGLAGGLATNGEIISAQVGPAANLGSLVNVLSYGAVPVTTSNSGQAILNATAAAYAAGSGIYIPAGNYSLADLTNHLLDFTTVWGNAPVQRFTIWADAGAIFYGNVKLGGTGTNGGVGNGYLYYSTLRLPAIQGNGAGGLASPANTDLLTLQQCWTCDIYVPALFGAQRDALVIDESAQGATTGCGFFNNHVRVGYISIPTRHGVNVKGQTYNQTGTFFNYAAQANDFYLNALIGSYTGSGGTGTKHGVVVDSQGVGGNSYSNRWWLQGSNWDGWLVADNNGQQEWHIAQASVNFSGSYLLGSGVLNAAGTVSVPEVWLYSFDTVELQSNSQHVNWHDMKRGFVDYPGALLAYKEITVSSGAITATTLTDYDATNYVLAFRAPTSGQVDVELSANVSNTVAGNAAINWGINIAGVIQRGVRLFQAVDSVASRRTIRLRLTGLTPGTTYTAHWQAASTSGASQCFAGAYSTGNGDTPSLMIIYAA